MTPTDIKIELLRAGVSQAVIAQQCDVSRTQVNRVIHDHNCVSDKVRRAIADAIKKDVKEIWPEYYLGKSITLAG